MSKSDRVTLCKRMNIRPKEVTRSLSQENNRSSLQYDLFPVIHSYIVHYWISKLIIKFNHLLPKTFVFILDKGIRASVNCVSSY